MWQTVRLIWLNVFWSLQQRAEGYVTVILLMKRIKFRLKSNKVISSQDQYRCIVTKTEMNKLEFWCALCGGADASAMPTDLQGMHTSSQQQPATMWMPETKEQPPPAWKRFVRACWHWLVGQAPPADLKPPWADTRPELELEVGSQQHLEWRGEVQGPGRGNWWWSLAEGLVPIHDSVESHHLPEQGQWDLSDEGSTWSPSKPEKQEARSDWWKNRERRAGVVAAAAPVLL